MITSYGPWNIRLYHRILQRLENHYPHSYFAFSERCRGFCDHKRIFMDRMGKDYQSFVVLYFWYCAWLAVCAGQSVGTEIATLFILFIYLPWSTWDILPSDSRIYMCSHNSSDHALLISVSKKMVVQQLRGL